MYLYIYMYIYIYMCIHKCMWVCINAIFTTGLMDGNHNDGAESFLIIGACVSLCVRERVIDRESLSVSVFMYVSLYLSPSLCMRVFVCAYVIHFVYFALFLAKISLLPFPLFVSHRRYSADRFISERDLTALVCTCIC